MTALNRLFSLLSITCIAALLFVSCSTPKALEYRDFKNLTIEKVGFTSSFAKMELVYYNPNNYGLQLNRTDLDIYINDVYMGRTAQSYQVNIPRKDTFSIPLKVEVDMRNIFKNGLNLMLKNEVMVKITGTLKVGKANVFMGIPVHYQGKQAFSIF